MTPMNPAHRQHDHCRVRRSRRPARRPRQRATHQTAARIGGRMTVVNLHENANPPTPRRPRTSGGGSSRGTARTARTSPSCTQRAAAPWSPAHRGRSGWAKARTARPPGPWPAGHQAGGSSRRSVPAPPARSRRPEPHPGQELAWWPIGSSIQSRRPRRSSSQSTGTCWSFQNSQGRAHPGDLGLVAGPPPAGGDAQVGRLVVGRRAGARLAPTSRARPMHRREPR